jgi:N-acetyl-gamma-glutamyl-phosphate reductase
MGKPRVFIDGHVGTTGLRIRDWLAERADLALVTLESDARKDPAARRNALNEADAVVLCLPDDAAREAVAWIENPHTRVIDASTAHRVSEGWMYGLPELCREQRAAIGTATRISNPGCYPTGVVLLLRPLIDAGLLPADAAISVHALSGYSGGGRTLIEKWQDPARDLLALPFEAPYALGHVHKHVPEMQCYAGLVHPPQFVPAVGPFETGMRIEIPLHAAVLAAGANAKSVWDALAARYAGEPFVRIAALADPPATDERSLDPRACNDTNRIELHVLPNPAGHVLLVAVLDNLGKGAAGAAIQNLNLALGLTETTGLRAA